MPSLSEDEDVRVEEERRRKRPRLMRSNQLAFHTTYHVVMRIPTNNIDEDRWRVFLFNKSLKMFLSKLIFISFSWRCIWVSVVPSRHSRVGNQTLSIREDELDELSGELVKEAFRPRKRRDEKQRRRRDKIWTSADRAGVQLMTATTRTMR